MPDNRSVEDKIQNVVEGFRAWGYWVSGEPIPGDEVSYYEHLRAGLVKIESHVEHLHTKARCRGRSKRTLGFLHGCGTFSLRGASCGLSMSRKPPPS